MVTDEDYLLLARYFLLLLMDLQGQVAALQLVIQRKTDITIEDIKSARAEAERLYPAMMKVKEQAMALGREDLLAMLRNFQGTVQ